MAGEPSTSGISNSTASYSSPSAAKYYGSLLSVISNSEIRYEGILCFLNSEDSTFGLKHVRLHGTEWRKKDGEQVPPTDKVYEYILFHVSDIKDLDVIAGPPVRKEELIYNDPAIIQAYAGPSSSSKSFSASSGSLAEIELNLHTEPLASNAMSYPSISPSHHSGTPLGVQGSSKLTHSASPSYVVPTDFNRYSGGPGSSDGTQQHSLSSTSTLHPLQKQRSTAMEMANLPNNASIHFNATPTLTSEQMSTSFTGSPSRKPSLPFHHSTLVHSSGLAMPSSLNYQDASSSGAQDADELFSGPSSFPAVQFPPYSPSLFLDQVSNPWLRQQQALQTPNLSQSKLSERSPNSPCSSSSATTPAVQSPSLLPQPSQKWQCSSKFTEEFDFEAMHQKFKKDEVWEYLGKANQRDKVERQHESRTTSQHTRTGNPELASKSSSKPAYSKDDFFDTVSCNSPTDGQIRFSERMRMDSETFGGFQWRTRSGYGRRRGGRGRHRGPHNGSRGRGAYAQRWT